MTLPTNPPIDMHMVCDEFQVPRDTPLASFVRGGGIVPNTPANANVPTALPISILDLLGAQRQPAVDIANASATDFTLVESGNNPYAELSVNSDGFQRKVEGAGQAVVIHTWLNYGVASDYRFRGTLNSGAVSGGTSFGTWATGVGWHVTRAVVGVSNATVLVEVAHKDALGTILDTCTLTLSATKEN